MSLAILQEATSAVPMLVGAGLIVIGAGIGLGQMVGCRKMFLSYS